MNKDRPAVTLNSMTGYARSQSQDSVVSWIWELKTVNGRGLELRLRLPPGYDFLDLPVREAVQKSLKRGNVNVTLNVARLQKTAGLTVNEALLEQYVTLAQTWQDKGGLVPASMDGLLALRGVLESGETEEAPAAIEARGAALKDGLAQALKALTQMRAAEGTRLKTVLIGQLDEIAGLVDQAEGCAALDPEAIKERLRQQVQALLDAVPALSEERLAQEAALIAAKADVREELDRLRAHLAAAREMLASGEAVGRKLDFLCQEFNREANTLCSKAGEVELTRIGLDLKAVIEQFREQVQNIE
ncbi:MAG TPA: YicC/YloC family endoribonuclease [Candidatus Sulfotelmatobacter sp.]|jgi:uncharacterized protein (TIGR00255 family)|nr:YicC/YloC family endoribonuclease [Candidatus Sulfotelmatobacter sp.]